MCYKKLSNPETANSEKKSRKALLLAPFGKLGNMAQDSNDPGLDFSQTRTNPDHKKTSHVFAWITEF
ncbi:hypothetical protein NIES2135_29090 [Leptolyngbya boryana NIES-2135]|uniref:Uncharacterized protein n=1 Tax=Leptolyngbya boryana NIES-2135 TaxID=1973484 RepID=A0A1Z4JH65_LEPBY|nr:hypothetical protein NIES2135_29090 [Leptolyngbya boryana NIES-2135]